MKKNRIHLLDIVPLLILVGILLVFAVLSKGATLSAYNLTQIFTQVVPVLIGSLGCIFVVSLGGTDISIGASAAMCATAATVISNAGTMGWISIPLSIIFGTAMGLIIGCIVTYLRVGSFICTLAVLIGAKGILSYFVSVAPVPAPKGIDFLTSFGFTIALLVIAVAVVVIVFEKTKFGFYCKCIGENERTVRSIGINVNRIRVICFTISGFFAGIVGIIQLCRLGGSSSTLCNMLEMKVQMAIFLGGILTTGGYSAKIYKLIVGSFTIVIIENGMLACGVNSAASEAIEGIILVGILITTIYCSKASVKKDLKAAAEAEKESIAVQS